MVRDDYNSEDVYSKPVRAGKRTYFFDVKSTKGNNDFFLTITESKRRNNPDGSFTYDKHKIFLYKEDFEKFREGLDEVITYIKDNCFGGTIPQREPDERSVEFEDL
ncbi:MAG: PUR family DNA/RNA-binding protein [Bacteroidales bacterium]|nr:PUR family DNA/RNA-binding protein [Bacteroidales bacterium]